LKKKGSTEQMMLSGTEEGEILARLQERVEKAVTLIQELRRERDQWKSRAEAAESQSGEKLATLEDEFDRFKKERGEIRDRIESILSNLEALEEN
jgi:FtsZ-binding cell division protein ZapB